MDELYGIIVYEILENGNMLNGIYTNSELRVGNRFAVDNEIIRKVTYDDRFLDGNYQSRWIENTSNNVVSAVLRIEQLEGAYAFTWTINEQPVWNGIGMMAGNSHIAVSYRRPIDR